MFSKVSHITKAIQFTGNRYFSMRASAPRFATLSFKSATDLENVVKESFKFDYQDFEMFAANQLQVRRIPVNNVDPEEGRKIMQDLMREFMQHQMGAAISQAVQKDVQRITSELYPKKTAYPDVVTPKAMEEGLYPGLLSLVRNNDLEGMVQNGYVQGVGRVAFKIRLFDEDFAAKLAALAADVRLWVSREGFTFQDGQPLNMEQVFGANFKEEGFIPLEDYGLAASIDATLRPFLNSLGQDAYTQAFLVDNVIGLLKDRVGMDVAPEDRPAYDAFQITSADALAAVFTHQQAKIYHEAELGSLPTDHVDVAIPADGVVNMAVCLDRKGHTLLVPAHLPGEQVTPEQESQMYQVPLRCGEALLFPDSTPVTLRIPQPEEGLGAPAKVQSLIVGGKADEMRKFWIEQTKTHLKRRHAEISSQAQADAQNKQQ